MLRMRLVGELPARLGRRALDAIASTRARSLLAWLAYHPGCTAHARRVGVLAERAREQCPRQPADHADDAAPPGGRRGRPSSSRRVAIASASKTARTSGSTSGRPDRLVADGRLEAALELADSDLLTDLDDDWVIEERTVHRDRVAAIVAALGAAAEKAATCSRRPPCASPARARARVRAGGARPHAATGELRRRRSGCRGLRSVPRDPAARLRIAPSAETRAVAEALRAVPRARAERPVRRPCRRHPPVATTRRWSAG